MNLNSLIRFLITVSVLEVVLGYTAIAKAEAKPTAKLTTQAKHILWTQLETSKVSNSRHNEVLCLAENIYFEARADRIYTVDSRFRKRLSLFHKCVIA